jgi:hypothetical protein
MGVRNLNARRWRAIMVAWGKVARLVWRYAKHKSVTRVGWEEAPLRMVTVRSYVRTWLPAAAHTVLPAAYLSSL